MFATIDRRLNVYYALCVWCLLSVQPVIATNIGDTFGTGALQLDIIGFTTERLAQTLKLSIQFDQSITLGAQGQTDAIRGLVELDLDNNSSTGTLSRVTALCPAGLDPLGVELSINLFAFDLATSSAPIINANSMVITNAAIGVSENQLNIEIPVTLLRDAINIHLAAILGPQVEGTDCLMVNVLTLDAVEVPTLNILGLLILVSLLLVGGFGMPLYFD